MQTTVEQLRIYLETEKQRHIGRIQRFIAQPSISVDGNGVRESAELLVEYYKELGCQEAELVETDNGLPGVWAYYDAGAEKTIANYANFDTRPVVDPDGWDNPPFSGALVDMPPFGKVMVGRGARAYKGPYIAWLNALEALIAQTGTLPVNVQFLVEGDEILGSPSYPAMFAKYRRRLESIDACFSPGISQNSDGTASLIMGFKTFIPLELRITGTRWGRGPQEDPVHAMAKSVVDSPTWRLIHALASLTEEDGNTVKLKGFYDQVAAVSDEEKDRVTALRQKLGNRPFGKKPWQDLLRGGEGVKRAINDWSDEDVFLNYYYGPSFNIFGLRAGYTGPGTKAFTLPAEASCRIDIRLPRGSKAAPVITSLQEHFEERGLQDLEIEVLGAYDAYVNDPDSSLAKAIREVFEGIGVPLLEIPCSGGGGPWSLFATELGVPSIRDVGVGFGGNVGSPNEFLVVDSNTEVGGLVDCELVCAKLLLAYAAQ